MRADRRLRFRRILERCGDAGAICASGSETQQLVCSVCPLERLVHHNRRLKNFRQQKAAAMRGGEAYPCGTLSLGAMRERRWRIFQPPDLLLEAVGLRCLISRAR